MATYFKPLNKNPAEELLERLQLKVSGLESVSILLYLKETTGGEFRVYIYIYRGLL